MVLTCPKCEARLQLDEAKTPSRPFAVRCPKCQTSVNVQPTTDSGSQPETSADSGGLAPFERPPLAEPFNPNKKNGHSASVPESNPGLNDIARLLAEALQQPGVPSVRAADRRKALVCSSPAYREVIAESLVEHDYKVFVADNMAQGLNRMREERMDVIVLDANFDPVEQGVAFITREVRLLRPSERRKLFLVYLTSGVRTMDLHAAFLQNVNMVINPSDIEQLPEALEVSIRHYNELYRPFLKAMDVDPI